jgi:penicillin-insensitive murein DD-endopeptidase
MPNFPNWTLSQQSRDRLSDLLKNARELGLDPEAVAAGGLAALQALIALKRANEAGEGAGRAQSIARVQEAVRGLDPVGHGDLLQQIQSRILALQGRNGDTEVAHVTPGEIVLPKALQTPAVLGALRQAAADADIPLDRLRIGSALNSINPATGRPEFAAFPQQEIDEITITAPRETGVVQVPQDIPDEFRVHGNPGGGVNQYGVPAASYVAGEASSRWTAEGRTPFSIGDLSNAGVTPYKGHSKTGDHATKGTGMDIRPLRKDGKNLPVTFQDPAYDREATQALVDTFKATAGVDAIYFNDPQIKGVTADVLKPGQEPIHHNHLHVRVSPNYRRPPRG